MSISAVVGKMIIDNLAALLFVYRSNANVTRGQEACRQKKSYKAFSADAIINLVRDKALQPLVAVL